MLVHGGEGIKEHLAVDMDVLSRALAMNSSLADPMYASSSVLSNDQRNQDLSGQYPTQLKLLFDDYQSYFFHDSRRLSWRLFGYKIKKRCQASGLEK